MLICVIPQIILQCCMVKITLVHAAQQTENIFCFINSWRSSFSLLTLRGKVTFFSILSIFISFEMFLVVHFQLHSLWQSDLGIESCGLWQNVKYLYRWIINQIKVETPAHSHFNVTKTESSFRFSYF